MAGITANLNNSGDNFDVGNDGLVIVKNLEVIPGGKTLDTTGFLPAVIKEGHVLIRKTSDGSIKPMPLLGSGTIESLGGLVGGETYTNGSYTDVALTGGSGAGATANITVAGTVVTIVTIVLKGLGYSPGDVLSADNSDIGGTGTLFSVAVATVGINVTGYAALPAGHTYFGIVISSVLTSKPFVSVLLRGSVNHVAGPYLMTSILAAVKAALPLIRFIQD